MAFRSMAVRGACPVIIQSCKRKCPVTDNNHHLDERLVLVYSFLEQEPDASVACVINVHLKSEGL